MASTHRTQWFGPGIVALILYFSAAASADPSIDRDRAPREYQIERLADAEIRVDGHLDEPAWRDALSVRLDYEHFPGDGVAPPVETEALLVYDRKRLYVAFRCADPEPDAIRAHLMDRDQIERMTQDDHVGFLLDTFDDQRRAFQFLVNPFGVQADGVYNQLDQTEDYSWDIIWESAGRFTADGWQVEISIPFDQLRFPRSADAQTWGIDLGRSYPRGLRHQISVAYRDRDDSCLLCQLPKLTGLAGIERGLNLKLVPTLTASRTDAAEQLGGDLVQGDEDSDLGFTAHWGVTPSLTLAATVNPDFSQVEADAAQLDVNERFALFFPEQRPFFLEAADYFASTIPLVFTRTVVDPEWGLRLTGKEGPSALGFFVARDRVNNITLPRNEGTQLATLDGEVDSAVARWRRDLGSSSTIGGFYSGREGENGYANHVAGVDSYLRFGPKQDLTVQALFSDTEYPEDFALEYGEPTGSFGGHALELIYTYSSRDWIGIAGYRNYGRGFRADSGFVTRVDLETYRADLQRQIWGDEDDPWVRARFGTTVITTDDQSGELSDQRLSLFGNVVGSRQSFFEVQGTVQDVRSQGILFESLVRGELFGEIRPNGSLALTASAEVGETVDFENAQLADVVSWTSGIEIQAGDHVNARLDLEQEILDVEAGRLYDARIAQLRLVYQFSVRTFIRGIFQYLDISREEGVDPAGRPDLEELLSQVLFSYKLNPETALFLGYSDTRFGFAQGSLDEADRTFFLKIGYAWSL